MLDRLTQRDRQGYSQFGIPSYPNPMHGFGLYGEAGIPRENTQTPHIKTPAGRKIESQDLVAVMQDASEK